MGRGDGDPGGGWVGVVGSRGGWIGWWRSRGGWGSRVGG